MESLVVRFEQSQKFRHQLFQCSCYWDVLQASVMTYNNLEIPIQSNTGSGQMRCLYVKCCQRNGQFDLDRTGCRTCWKGIKEGHIFEVLEYLHQKNLSINPEGDTSASTGKSKASISKEVRISLPEERGHKSCLQRSNFIADGLINDTYFSEPLLSRRLKNYSLLPQRICCQSCNTS